MPSSDGSPAAGRLQRPFHASRRSAIRASLFPGNVIPQAHLDPVAQTRAGTGSASQRRRQPALLHARRQDRPITSTWSRVDHQFSPRQQLSGRYFFDGLDIPAILDQSNILTAIANRRWQSQSAVANYTFTASPTLLSNTSLSYNRASNIATQPDFPGSSRVRHQRADPFQSAPPSAWASPSTSATPTMRSTACRATSTTSSIPGRGFADVINSNLALTFCASRASSIRIFSRMAISPSAAASPETTWPISCIGKPSAFTQITVLYNSLIRNLYGLYVQDTFKVNRHLTLNLGVRWNPFIPFTDSFARQISQWNEPAYQANVRSTRFPNLPPGQLAAGDPGVPEGRGGGCVGIIRSASGLCLGCVRQRQDEHPRRLRAVPRPDCRRSLTIARLPRRPTRSASTSQRRSAPRIPTVAIPTRSPFRGRFRPLRRFPRHS